MQKSYWLFSYLYILFTSLSRQWTALQLLKSMNAKTLARLEGFYIHLSRAQWEVGQRSLLLCKEGSENIVSCSLPSEYRANTLKSPFKMGFRT